MQGPSRHEPCRVRLVKKPLARNTPCPTRGLLTQPARHPPQRIFSSCFVHPFPRTYPYAHHNHSAKMLAARGIYKAVARRGVHTTRVLASTKRK